MLAAAHSLWHVDSGSRAHKLPNLFLFEKYAEDRDPEAPSKTGNPLILRAGASDSEDDLAGIEDSHMSASALQTSANMPPRRRASTATSKRKAAPKTQKRQVLKDRTNIQADNDTEEVDEFEDDGGKSKPKRAKTLLRASRLQPGSLLCHLLSELHDMPRHHLSAARTVARLGRWWWGENDWRWGRHCWHCVWWRAACTAAPRSA